jgi:hypothetical protein
MQFTKRSSTSLKLDLKKQEAYNKINLRRKLKMQIAPEMPENTQKGLFQGTK